MTETQNETVDAPAKPEGTAKKRGGGLNSMLLADLKSMAGGLGIKGAGSMKKAQLVDAIKAAQSGGQSERPSGGQSEQRQERAEQRQERAERQDDGDRQQGGQNRQQRGQGQNRQQAQQSQRNQQQNQQQKQQQQQDDGQGDGDQQDDGDGDGTRRNRRRRGRDRDRSRGGRNEPDTTILEDDVLVPAAGILDVLDNYAFVRTSGYLPGPDDVYLSLSMVRRYGLRRGDAIVGQVRQPREGERKEKFNPMVRIDSVNGADPEVAKNRADFTTATPVHPTEQLRLETGADDLVGRVVDIAAPLGKGQRGLLVSPASAGKTTILQSVSAAVTANNPECHLMVVLVDERPEEVTDFQRSVKGEVIASTFDRPPADHTTVAELAIERAKRLVELGHDVVVLLDGLTRLGRAYNLSAPTSGRTLAGGVDASALYPTKRFFGAARKLEDGGSLTILATALVESGSAVDELLVDELTGTENFLLRLSGDLADLRVFPAVDLVQSGTRHEAELVGQKQHAALDRLRTRLAGKGSEDGLRELLDRLGRTHSNDELLGSGQ